MSPVMPTSHSEMMMARRRRLAQSKRPTPDKLGYGSRWKRLRLMVLARNPMCQICKTKPSEHVDHIVAKADGGDDSMKNLQGLCQSCHSRKTAKEQQKLF